MSSSKSVHTYRTSLLFSFLRQSRTTASKAGASLLPPPSFLPEGEAAPSLKLPPPSTFTNFCLALTFLPLSLPNTSRRLHLSFSQGANHILLQRIHQGIFADSSSPRSPFSLHGHLSHTLLPHPRAQFCVSRQVFHAFSLLTQVSRHRSEQVSLRLSKVLLEPSSPFSKCEITSHGRHESLHRSGLLSSLENSLPTSPYGMRFSYQWCRATGQPSPLVQWRRQYLQDHRRAMAVHH